MSINSIDDYPKPLPGWLWLPATTQGLVYTPTTFGILAAMKNRHIPLRQVVQAMQDEFVELFRIAHVDCVASVCELVPHDSRCMGCGELIDSFEKCSIRMMPVMVWGAYLMVVVHNNDDCTQNYYGNRSVLCRVTRGLTPTHMQESLKSVK